VDEAVSRLWNRYRGGLLGRRADGRVLGLESECLLMAESRHSLTVKLQAGA